jgi:hypothetical protein
MSRPASLESAAASAQRAQSSWLIRSKALGLAMLAAGMLSSTLLITAPGTFDVTDPRRGFLAWMDDVVVLGPVDGYRYNPYDYPPGTKTLLGLAGKTGDALRISRPNSLKLLLLTFQALTALAAFVLTGNLLLTGAIWLGTTTSAIGQGYLDILYAPFLVVSLVSLQRNHALPAWGLLLVCCAIKPQPLVLLPFYAVHLTRLGSLKDISRVARDPGPWGAAIWTAIAVLLLVVTFGRTQETRQWAVVQAVQKATAHKEISGNAMNAGWIGSYIYQVAKYRELGPARERDSTWRNPIKVVAAAIVAWILWLQIGLPKTPHTVLLCLLAGYLAYFTFNAGVHENHLFIAMIIALFLATMPDELRHGWSRTREVMLAIGVIAFALLNPLLFFGWRGGEREPTLIGGPTGLDISVPLATFSIVLFVATVLCLRAAGRPAMMVAQESSRR